MPTASAHTQNPSSAGSSSADTDSKSYGFVIDNRNCIGCHACTVACKTEHEDPVGTNRTWVSYIEQGVFPNNTRNFHVMRCNHCSDAPCVEICPTACLETRSDGIVDFDPSRCVGCKACMQACPYDALDINPDSGTATKCNFCSHRVDMGREPACVSVCPTQAIVAGDMNDPDSKIAQLVAKQETSVRKPEKGTKPKLHYIEGDANALNPTSTVRNTKTLWGERPSDATLNEIGISIPSTPGEAATLESVERGAPTRVYDIPQRHAASWGPKVSAYLFTKSIAAGAFLIPAVFALFNIGKLPNFLSSNSGIVDKLNTVAPLIALIALGITGALLALDLKRPERFLWVLLRPQWKSWLVRGAYIITAYAIFLVLYWPFSTYVYSGLGKSLFVIGGILAAGTAAYSGWLFGQAKGRDFWQSPLAPFHLLVQAFLAGSAFYGIFYCKYSSIQNALLVCLLVNLACVVVEIWGRHSTQNAALAAKMFYKGRRAPLFLGGVLAAGHILPIVFLWSGNGAACCIASILTLVGLAIYEHLWVEAPQRIPLA